MTLLAVFLWGLDIEVTEASSNNIKRLETSGTYQLVCLADGKISVSTQLMGRSTNEYQDGKIQRPTHKSGDVDISKNGILIEDDQGL
jgi:hypothetical protein